MATDSPHAQTELVRRTTARGAHLFDLCAQCRRCCVVDPGEPPLEVSLTRAETKRFGSLCIETRCTHLGPQGCRKGDDKPFSCALYPLSFDPHERRFSFDSECPLLPTYVAQLSDARSEASAHLAAMTREIVRLERDDPGFLLRNREIDLEYFDLTELPSETAPGPL
jgi:hypothetical protein